jgi:nicotinate-nucleotide adenylyltransferase
VRTGIFGGTFDPIHIAHLHTAETVLTDVALDRMLFIPAGDPWQKDDRALTPARHRLEMVRLATAGVGGFEVDDREVGREGPSYTIDTLSSFPADEDLYLLVGADAAAGFRTWHRWEEILKRAVILIMPRPGTDLEAARQAVPGAVIVHTPLLEVSATAIRDDVANGRAYRFLVHPAVHAYIEANHLYEQAGSGDMVVASNEQEESS